MEKVDSDATDAYEIDQTLIRAVEGFVSIL